MAAGSMTVEVHGLENLVASMSRAGAAIATLPEANAKAGSIIATRARGIAPRRTGRLAASIRPVPGSRSAAAVSAGGGGVRYAAFQEFGTMRNPARRYMSTALLSTQPQWLPAYTRGIQQEISKIHGA